MLRGEQEKDVGHVNSHHTTWSRPFDMSAQPIPPKTNRSAQNASTGNKKKTLLETQKLKWKFKMADGMQRRLRGTK